MDTRARLAALEAELAELRDQLSAEQPVNALDTVVTSRRKLLGRAGVVAAGAAAAVVASASPAAANDPNDLTLGASKAAGGLTMGNYTGSTSGTAFVFQLGNELVPTNGRTAALGAWSTGGAGAAGPHFGLFAFNNTAGGTAAFAGNDAADGTAVSAVHSGAGAALYAASNAGPTLLLEAGNTAPAMPPAAGAWVVGSVVRSTDGHLWYCTASGTGTASRWVRLSSGGLTLLATPQRAYDTRDGAGPFEGTTTRVVSLASAGVPAGAAGALLNLTATDTSGVGYVQVYSADVASPPATSNLNWDHSGQIIANNATTAVNSAGQIKITTQGGTAAVIVDVFGYYS